MQFKSSLFFVNLKNLHANLHIHIIYFQQTITNAEGHDTFEQTHFDQLVKRINKSYSFFCNFRSIVKIVHYTSTVCVYIHNEIMLICIFLNVQDSLNTNCGVLAIVNEFIVLL